METEAEVEVSPSSFTCEKCGKSFLGKSSLGVHNWYEHRIRAGYRFTSEPFTRPVCAPVFKGYSEYSPLQLLLKSPKAASLSPFKCDKCSVDFKTALRLKKHQKIHEENRPKFKCGLCSKELTSAFILQRHVIAVHVKDKQFQCSICSRGFVKEKELETHMRENHGRKSSCDMCPKHFVKKYSLRNHVHRVHSRTEFCLQCLKSFGSKEENQRHIQEVGGGSVPCPDSVCELAFGTACLAAQHWSEFHQPKIEPPSSLSCGKGMKQKNKDDGVKEEVCKTAVESSVVTEDKMEENSRFDCSFCEKYFPTYRILRAHEKQVHPNEVWQCRVCHKTFKRRSGYNRHMRNCHITDPKYKCQVCSKLLGSSERYKDHVKSHDPDKPYKCSKCPLSFTLPGKLRYHLAKSHGEEGVKPYKSPIGPARFLFKSHSAAKSFRCDDCPKRYTTKKALLEHKQKSCPANENRSNATKNPRREKSDEFKCEICSKMFVSERGLLFHVRQHDTDKPFKCSKCPKSFITRTCFRTHLAVVHRVGEIRYYKCPHCPKKYYNRFKLEQLHIPSHFDARPFSCDGCPLTFKDKYAVRTHKVRGRCPGDRAAGC